MVLLRNAADRYHCGRRGDPCLHEAPGQPGWLHTAADLDHPDLPADPRTGRDIADSARIRCNERLTEHSALGVSSRGRRAVIGSIHDHSSKRDGDGADENVVTGTVRVPKLDDLG